MRQWRPTPVLRRRFHPERRSLPPAVGLVGLLLFAGFLEVWRVTRISELTIAIDRIEATAAQTEARRDYLDAQLAAARTRPALTSMARSWGMKPAEPAQIVVVPAAFLAGGSEASGTDRGLTGLAGLGRRTLDFLVQEARARTR
jgi:hypothetical protein